MQRSTERRQHIIKEFERVGIPANKYTFFPAVDASQRDGLVQEILNNRGHQTLADGSTRTWRNLNRYQIGNWCSYLGVWYDILKNGYNICMICEDDIKFADYAKQVTDKIFNWEYISQRVDPSHPFVIGLGSGYQDSVHNPPANFDPELSKKPLKGRDCNPCHIINGLMAQELLAHSRRVTEASDPYIHNFVSAKHQRLWAYPQPIYELSWNPQKKQFDSTIEGPLGKGDRL